MSNIEDFNAKKDVINAIADELVKSPNMPVDRYLQEAETLHKWCQADKEALTAKGLDWNLVTDLPVRAGALRESQSNWSVKRFVREGAEKQWNADSPGAYSLRDQLLRDFRYAFRKNTDLLTRVAEIADGNGHADMIQDLNDLAILGKQNAELLQKTNFDLALLDKAAAISKDMAGLLSQSMVDSADSSRELVMRDKAYTHLKEAVDEIRSCGQYVFWNNEERLKGYISAYHKKARKAMVPEAPPPAVAPK